MAALSDFRQTAKRDSAFAIRKELNIYAEDSQPVINKSLCLNGTIPLLMVEQRLFDQQNKPIGWEKTYHKHEYGKIKPVRIKERRIEYILLFWLTKKPPSLKNVKAAL
ncbi:MAG TPA: hypothetical protein VN379_24030 [Sporomusa sp.]|nr:hypothetical protein [Sporomusa sp.]